MGSIHKLRSVTKNLGNSQDLWVIFGNYNQYMGIMHNIWELQAVVGIVGSIPCHWGLYEQNYRS